ncbi:hypothetical protein J2W22_000319 [Sphingomonas kyeonggiensis]|uniref:hypothetical protein n=1 Tax=Sphingomonas kyeonggiensis TaxID=1268553 RepID=UPI002784A24B|nr:hypothetical protein [Sphingomonas kyeonggiensis]MDQ0248272.1 hypothetical protein [Sphingomonas kyeonggiensis]
MSEPRRPIFHRDRMEYWAFVAQIVSALAVVASLVFVGLQLYDSNRVAARSEANDTQAQWSSFRASIYSSHDTAEMFRAGLEGSQALDPADQLRFDYLMREHGWATYQVWERVRDGLMPRAHYEAGQGADFVRVICTRGGWAVWSRIKIELARPYVDDMDRMAAAYARANPGKVGCTG